MKNKTFNTSIRLDPELYQRIKDDAGKEKRSISGQIEYMIMQYYEMRKILLR